MRKLTLGLLWLYSFAVPWEYSLDLGEPWGNVARVLGLLLLLAVVPLVLSRREIRRPGVLQWLVLGFYLYFALSCFWTMDGDATAEKIRSYFQVMMIVWIVWEAADSARVLRRLMRAFVAGCGVLAVLTILDYVSPSAIAAEQIRFVAEGQDPNDVARFLDLGFPLAALLFAVEVRWWKRLLAVAYLPLGFLAVLLTASRGGFSGALVAAIGSAVLLLVWRKREAGLVLAGMAATAGVLWMLVPVESLRRLATIPEQLGTGDLNDRLTIWIAGFHAFAQAPWFGYGAGTYAAAAKLAAGDTAHNTGMAVLVTGGLMGACLLMAIVVAAGAAAMRTPGLLRIGLGTALLVWGLTAMVGSVEENRATWLLFALMGLAGRLATEEPGDLEHVFSGVETERVEWRAYAVR